MHRSLESSKALEKRPSLFLERDDFAQSVAQTKGVASFVKDTTETGRRFNASKTTHRIISLFDATMILLDPMVEVLTRPMKDIVAHGLAYRSWIGRMTIGCHLLWRMANHIDSVFEKSLSCLQIALLAQHGSHQIAILVARSIQITPFSAHFSVGFINRPRGSGFPSTLCWSLIGEQGSKASFPIPHRFTREDKATPQKQLSPIAQTPFGA